MYRVIVFLLIISTTLPTMADFVTYRGSVPNYRGNYQRRYYNNNYYRNHNRPNYQYKSRQSKPLLRNLGRIMRGTPTGFTPPIMPSISQSTIQGFGPYGDLNFLSNPNFTNNRIETYSNGLFGGSGFNITGSDYGSGSSIRILD